MGSKVKYWIVYLWPVLAGLLFFALVYYFMAYFRPWLAEMLGIENIPPGVH